MMDFSKWALHNRPLVYFFIAVFMVGGAWSCYRMSKLEDPEITVKLAMVVTTYPGASAHQVELEVTDVLEKSINTMGGIDNIESYSYADLSLIQVELTATTDDDDVEQQWDMLRRRVNAAASLLPPGANTPIVKDDFGKVYGMFYALTADGLQHDELDDYAELVKRTLQDLDDVDRVELYGKRNECIYISLLQDRMANLGVKPIEVLATLNGQNQTTYSGYFDNGSNRIRVTVTDKFTTVDDIGNMLIHGHDDDQLRLRDIAHIEKGEEAPVRNLLTYDRKQSIGVLVAAATGSDIVKVGTKVEHALEELSETRFPTGLSCHKVFFQPERVGDSLGTFVINLIESVLIVVLILMLAMGFKSGLIIGISLVVTVFGSFLFLQGFGGTMQRVSLGAFVLAMGMLVDNAIVIIDGILVDLKRGVPRMEALTAIGRRTAMPLLGATLIAILAFLPIFLSPDTAGVYTRDLFIVLAVSLLLSWVLALTHVPLMANRRLSGAVAGTAQENQYAGVAYKVLRYTLQAGLKHRYTFLLCMLGLLVLSGVGFFYMRQGFFPDMVYNQMYMEYKLPEGTNSTQVVKDLNEIQDYLTSRPEITHVTASVGGTPGRYNLVRSIANPSLAYGELIIDFTSPKTLEQSMDEIQNYLTAHYPDAYVKLKRYNLMFKKYPIEAQFRGPDPAVLHQLADSARAIMERSDAVQLITTNWDDPVPTLSVSYDQPAARSLGLSRADVSMSLLTATSGLPVGCFYQGIHRNNIYVKCLDGDGNPIPHLGNTQVFSSLPSVFSVFNRDFMVKFKTGTLQKDEIVEAVMGSTPLRAVSTSVDIVYEDPVIPRYNGQRCQSVQCSPAPGMETEKARKAVAEKIEQIELPAGYTLQWQGEKEANTRSMKYLFSTFPVAIILIIAILIMLFKDYKKPAIIMLCLPFILVGVVAVMLATGKTFNFVAIVGTLGLIGMLIKNGIVLMDEITLELSEGVEPVQALLSSAQSRLRPVMMASLTTILGMIPLLNDAMFGSLAASVMGGLLFASIITLLFIPVLYALFFHIKNE